jgi:hypothetical protein
MVFNATFNNISAISRRSVLLLEETGVPGENHRPAVSHWQIYSILFYWVCYAMSGVRTHNVSGYIHWLHRELYIHLLYVHDRRRPLKVKKKENTRKQIKTKGYTRQDWEWSIKKTTWTHQKVNILHKKASFGREKSISQCWELSSILNKFEFRVYFFYFLK